MTVTNRTYPEPCFFVGDIDIRIDHRQNPSQIVISWSEKRWHPGSWFRQSHQLPFTNHKITSTIRQIMNESGPEIIRLRKFDELLMEALL